MLHLFLIMFILSHLTAIAMDEPPRFKKPAALVTPAPQVKFKHSGAFKMVAQAKKTAAKISLKRSSSEESGDEHFLTRRTRSPRLSSVQQTAQSSPMQGLVEAIQEDDSDKLFEDVSLPVECKYFGHKDCERKFVDEMEEWKHICSFHKIVAARGDENIVWSDINYGRLANGFQFFQDEKEQSEEEEQVVEDQ